VDRVAEAVAEVASFLGSTHMPPCRLVAAAPELGPDQLQVVRKTTAFSEGDSMQGSYFCDRVGTYILQVFLLNLIHI
jgi:hypothetical protein